METNTDKKEMKRVILDFMVKHSTFIVFILMVIIASFTSSVFFTKLNILNLLRQISPLGVGAMGMLLVILTGGIDLSIGALMAFAGVLFATFLTKMALIPALMLTLLAGTFLGGVNGFFVSRKNIAPFVVTLAMMTMARGWALLIAKGSPVLIDNIFLSIFGQGYLFGIPLPVFLMLIVFGITSFILNKTVLGRITTAIGSNETAVRLAGIQVNNYKHFIYAIAAFMFALAGIISTSRTMVGSPILAIGFELDTIAAVVIGGASLSGGKGSALNTLLGVLILGMISNIMNLMNVPGYHQQVAKGIIIIVAVLIQGYNKQKNETV
jgi:ribose transport system permease protein